MNAWVTLNGQINLSEEELETYLRENNLPQAKRCSRDQMSTAVKLAMEEKMFSFLPADERENFRPFEVSISNIEL